MKQGGREPLAPREAVDLSTGKITVSVNDSYMQGFVASRNSRVESGVAEVKFRDMGKSQAVVLQEPEYLRPAER